MKTFTLPATRELLRPVSSKQASGQVQLASLEKLSDLTHRFQHLLRYRPKGMARLLPYYHYFLGLKENLEHYFAPNQQVPPAPRGLPVSQPETRVLALTRLKNDLAAFMGPNSPVDLRKYSPALFLLFQELESLLKEEGGRADQNHLKPNHSTYYPVYN